MGKQNKLININCVKIKKVSLSVKILISFHSKTIFFGVSSSKMGLSLLLHLLYFFNIGDFSQFILFKMN